MKNQELFLRLLKDLEPLKKSLAGNFDYRSLRFSYEDIVGFLDDKLLHVFLRYDGIKPYEDLKAIAITSLTNLIYKLYKKYSREVSLEGLDIPETTPEEDFSKQLDHLMESLSQVLDPEEALVAKMIISPPMYITSRVKDVSKRIPSHLYLEFMDIPVNKASVKRFNSYRRKLFTFIRENIDPQTFELTPQT